MDQNELKNEIKGLIREGLEKAELRNYVRGIVSEEINKLFEKKAINEAGEGGNSVIKRKAVMNMLKNDKYDHAYLAYQLWHPKDDNEKDTYRSLFSKKATGKPDNDGAVRSFTDEEITKLYELIRKN